jgi:kinetochore protein NDC80
LERLRTEQERLAIVVKEQNLSPEEVAQMNTEQETLSRLLDELRRKNAETSNQMRSLEVALAKRSENVEQAIDEYTELLHQLGLFPNVPHPLPPAGMDLRLEINFASPNPRELIRRTADGPGQIADLRGEIKGALDSIAEYKRRQHMTVEDEAANLENELDDIGAETDRMEEEIESLEQKTNNVQEEAEAIRITTQQEANASNAEVQRLQKELSYARSAALASGVGVKSRLQALQIA